MAVFVLLPAYNEARALPALLRRIEDTPNVAGAVVVDDGSTDGTATVVEGWLGTLPLVLLRHSQNRGLGAAMATGIHWAVENLDPEDVLVAMDADDTQDPALIPAMLDRVRGGCDVVIASRFCQGGKEVGVPLYRRLLSRCARLAVFLLRPVPGVRDYSCGYRAYRVGALQRALQVYELPVFITQVGFAVMVEILLRLAATGSRFAEVPLVLRYDRKRGSRSKMRILRTVARYIYVLFKVPRSAVVRGRVTL